MAKNSMNLGTYKRMLARLTKAGYEQNNIILTCTYPSLVADAIKWSLGYVAGRAGELLLTSLKSPTKIAKLQPHLALGDQRELSGSKQGEVAVHV